ncbi:unnamed protein product [Lota lota]
MEHLGERPAHWKRTSFLPQSRKLSQMFFPMYLPLEVKHALQTLHRLQAPPSGEDLQRLSKPSMSVGEY